MNDGRGRGVGAERRASALAFACGVVVLASAAVVASHAPAWQHTEVVLVALGVGAVAWWGAVELARRGHGSIPLIVGVAIALRALQLTSWPDLSDDVHRYVWEGELVARGVSPYAFSPDAVELNALREELPEVAASLNHPEISAAYPPVTQAACAGVVTAARALGVDAVLALRVAFALCDLLVLVPLLALLRRAALPPALAVVWAWCPLVALEFAGSGHFDSLGILLLLGALALASRAAEAFIALPLAGAILVKFLPVVALPFLARDVAARDGGIEGREAWQGRGRRLIAWTALLGAMAYAPLGLFDGGFRGLFAGLGEYGLRWQSSGLLHPYVAALCDTLFEQDGGPFDARRVARGLLGLTWLGVLVLAWLRRYDAVRATGILLGAFLLLTPTLHPWYVTWIVPFVALRPRAAWLWLVATVPLAYAPLAAWKQEGVWEQPLWIRLAISIPLFVLLLWPTRTERRA